MDTITVESIISDTPRVKLAQLIVADPTLNTARLLADKQAEGYQEMFGHFGRNKIMSHQRKLFYSPSMSVDVANHAMFVRNIQNTIPKSFPCKRGKL